MAFMDFLSRIGVILGVYPEEAPADDRAPDYDEEYAAEDYYAPQANIREEPAASQARGGMGAKRSAAQSGYEPEEDPGYSTRRAAPNNVVQMPTRSESDPRRHSEMIVCVRRVEDSQNIINSLIEGRSVMLNLEEIDDTQRQRVIDMLGGAAFAQAFPSAATGVAAVFKDSRHGSEVGVCHRVHGAEHGYLFRPCAFAPGHDHRVLGHVLKQPRAGEVENERQAEVVEQEPAQGYGRRAEGGEVGAWQEGHGSRAVFGQGVGQFDECRFEWGLPRVGGGGLARLPYAVVEALALCAARYGSDHRRVHYHQAYVVEVFGRQVCNVAGGHHRRVVGGYKGREFKSEAQREQLQQYALLVVGLYLRWP